MGDDHVCRTHGGKKIVIGFAEGCGHKTDHSFAALFGIEDFFNEGCVVERDIRPDRQEFEALRDDFIAVERAGGDGYDVAALLKFQGDGEVRMKVAVGAESVDQDARHRWGAGIQDNG